MLEGFEMTYEQFIDMCILCGCDYTKVTIRNIGPIFAYKFIKLHGDIEGVIENVVKKNPARYVLPENMDHFDFVKARELFKMGEMEEELNQLEEKIKLGKLMHDDLIVFLEGRVKKNIKNAVKNSLQKHHQKITSPQLTMMDFIENKTI